MWVLLYVGGFLGEKLFGKSFRVGEANLVQTPFQKLFIWGKK